MSTIEVNKITPVSGGTTVQVGESGDTINIPAGATLANAGSVTGLPASAISSGVISSARLGTGTASSSTVLYGDGTFKAEPGGGLVHIATVSGTSNTAAVKLNDVFTSTYKTYKVFGTFLMSTDGTKLEMKYTKSNGTVSGDSGYRYLFEGEHMDSGSSIGDASNGNYSDTGGVELAYNVDEDGATYSPIQLELTFYDPLQSFASYQYFNGMITYYQQNGNWVQGTIGGQYRQNFNATGFKFAPSSNNIQRHYVNVYGIANSGA